MIKATAIDPAVVDADGVYRKTGPARVFTSEREAIAAIKGQGRRTVQPGDVLVLIGRGPLGSGMEETYQLTSALKYLQVGTRRGGGDRCSILRRQHRSLYRSRRSGSIGRVDPFPKCETAIAFALRSIEIACSEVST